MSELRYMRKELFDLQKLVSYNERTGLNPLSEERKERMKELEIKIKKEEKRQDAILEYMESR